MCKGDKAHTGPAISLLRVPKCLIDLQDEEDVPLYNVTVPISMSITVMVSYICGGALLFAEWEGWGFLDGSYFCFITLR